VEVAAQRIEQRGTIGESIATEYAEALVGAYSEVLTDAESRGVYVHRVDWSRDLSDKGLYHAHADTMISGFMREVEDRLSR